MASEWVKFRFNVMGEQQVARAFEVAAHDAQDMSEPLREIGTQILHGVSEQFRTEGVSGLGQKWTALNPAYAAWKRGAVGDKPILDFHTDMRTTLTQRAAIRVEPRRLIYRPQGKHDDIAALHQVGEGVPERKIVAITDMQKRTWDREFLSWMRRDVLTSFN